MARCFSCPLATRLEAAAISLISVIAASLAVDLAKPRLGHAPLRRTNRMCDQGFLPAASRRVAARRETAPSQAVRIVSASAPTHGSGPAAVRDGHDNAAPRRWVGWGIGRHPRASGAIHTMNWSIATMPSAAALQQEFGKVLAANQLKSLGCDLLDGGRRDSVCWT